MTRREYLILGTAAGRLWGQRPAGAPVPGTPAPAPPSAKITSSVALGMLEGTFEERVRTAAQAGMQGVELEREYAGWDDAAMVKARKLAGSFGMRIDAITAAVDWNEGDTIGATIEAARRLSCPQVILPGASNAASGKFAEGIGRAGEAAGRAGVTLLVPVAIADGLKLVRDAGTPHVRLLFDIQDEYVKGGEVLAAVKEAVDYTCVFRVADAPGRSEPGKGKIKFKEIYQAIQKAGYSRYICMRYVPVGDPVASLIRAVDGFRAALNERPLVTSS